MKKAGRQIRACIPAPNLLQASQRHPHQVMGDSQLPSIALADRCLHLLVAPLPPVVQVVNHQVRHPMEGGEVGDLLHFPVAEPVHLGIRSPPTGQGVARSGSFLTKVRKCASIIVLYESMTEAEEV